MAFLPENYEGVKDTGSRYMKFEQGDNRFRIMSDAVVGFEYWVTEDGTPRTKDSSPQKGDRPVRVRGFEDLPAEARPVAREFWAFSVFNYETGSIQILQVTQKTILKALQNFVSDDDWGDPKEYDIVVNRTGVKLDTEYAVTPKPHKPMPKEAKESWDVLTVNLNALFVGDDPFTSEALEDDESDEEVDLDEIIDDIDNA